MKNKLMALWMLFLLVMSIVPVVLADEGSDDSDTDEDSDSETETEVETEVEIESESADLPMKTKIKEVRKIKVDNRGRSEVVLRSARARQVLEMRNERFAERETRRDELVSSLREFKQRCAANPDATACQEIESRLGTSLERLVDRLTNALDALDRRDVDTSAVRALVERADEQLQNGDVRAAKKLLQEAVREFKNLVKTEEREFRTLRRTFDDDRRMNLVAKLRALEVRSDISDARKDAVRRAITAVERSDVTTEEVRVALEDVVTVTATSTA